jgi:hypothetical protein
VILISAYAALTLAVIAFARMTGGPSWAGGFILIGLALTVAARLLLDPAVLFLALSLIWVVVGVLIAARGEGLVSVVLIASGLCYLGAEIIRADAPGLSMWFRAADSFGLAALVTVAAGGDGGIYRLAYRLRRSLGGGDRARHSGRLVRVASVQEEEGGR